MSEAESKALKSNIVAVRQRIAAAARAAGRDPESITLCAATKVQTSETIRSAIAGGIAVCGENRVQELVSHLSDGAYEGAEVHFIGHLQRNKVKQVVGRVDMIQSVDGEELLRLIDVQAVKLRLRQNILLEVNIAKEESKSGLTPEEARRLAELCSQLPGISLRGLMAIPPVSEVPGDNRPFFRAMHQLFVDIGSKKYDNRESSFDVLSMGMSGDFEDAIAEGATLVRVGTALFGQRPPRR